MGSSDTENHAVIHVQFFDWSTGAVFAESHIPIDQLPQSFEARTTLHLGNDDWSVVEARPVTAAEYRRAGKLTLVLQQVKTALVDPGDILYTLPTITNDALPPVAAGSTKLGVDVIEIHEDDWRQIEWVSGATGEAIQSELESIRRIYEEQRQGVGFKKLHLRCAIPTPLDQPGPDLDALRLVIGPRATWLAGLAYRGIAGIVASSFAVRLISSIEIYGVTARGKIQAVCFANTCTNNMPQPDIQNLARFAAAHDLVLVDWCRATAVAPVEEDYTAYFVPTDG